MNMTMISMTRMEATDLISSSYKEISVVAENNKQFMMKREWMRIPEINSEKEGDHGVVHKMDKWGYPVKTSSDACISAINSYYDQALNYGRDQSVILEALLNDEQCVLAHTLAANYFSTCNSSKASFHLSKAQSRLDQATEYEKTVFKSICSFIDENRDDDVAADSFSKLLKQFPRDLASLKRAHALCFCTGRPDILLNLVEQVLPHNQQENYVYGLLAFPLLELGRMADAEEAARKALKINVRDFWAQHNLCHVFQAECRYKEAVEFMEDCSSSWSLCSSFMHTHNWWHLAACYLEGNFPIGKVLEIYDQCILKELQRSDASCEGVYLNALALLLLVHVRGKMTSFGDRLNYLADRVMNKSTWNLEWHLDLLIVWALASTDKVAKAEELLYTMKSRIYSMTTKKQQSMQRGILLAEALYEYGRGNYEKTFELLGPEFDVSDYKMIGASDEQLNGFSEVWYCVLLNTGRFSKAIEEIEKRIKKSEGVPFLWRLLEKAYAMAGREDTSVISEKARALEAAYF